MNLLKKMNMKKVLFSTIILIMFASISIDAQVQFFYNIEGTWKSNSGKSYYIKYSWNNLGKRNGLVITRFYSDVFYPAIVSSTHYIEKEYLSGRNLRGSYSSYNEYHYYIIDCFNIKVDTYANGKYIRTNYWEKLY